MYKNPTFYAIFVPKKFFSYFLHFKKTHVISFRKTIIFLKNIGVYAILLVDLIMEKIHET